MLSMFNCPVMHANEVGTSTPPLMSCGAFEYVITDNFFIWSLICGSQLCDGDVRIKIVFNPTKLEKIRQLCC